MSDSPFSLFAALRAKATAPRQENGPGQSALVYHDSHYEALVSRMLGQLRQQQIKATATEAETLPLAKFNVLAEDDWTIAFLQAWAIVGDVLSFYQERILNEGYLRTATERRSVLELTRMIGYELTPPLAAKTYLAFTVYDEGEHVVIPRQTAVQGVPDPFSSTAAVNAIVEGNANTDTSLPVVFETTESFMARPAWNKMHPSQLLGLAWPKATVNSPNSLRLQGVNLQLNPGDGLLIVGKQTPQEAWELLIISEVTTDLEKNLTSLKWEVDSFGEVPEAGISDPLFYALRKRTTLFPYAAGSLFCQTEQGFAPINIGLPPKPIRATVANQNGRLYVGVEQSVYALSDEGATWRALDDDLPPNDVHALATNETGSVAVGTSNSGIHLSKDGGDSWIPLSGSSEVDLPTGWRRFFESVRLKLPKTIVRSLLFANVANVELLAGTDDGVFGYAAQADSWVSMNGRFPQLDRKKGTAPLSVRAIAAVENGRRILAGTSNGIFPVRPLFKAPDSKTVLLFLTIMLLLPSGADMVLPDANAVEFLLAIFQPIFGQLAGWLQLGVLAVYIFQLKPVRLQLVTLGLIGLFFLTSSFWLDALAPFLQITGAVGESDGSAGAAELAAPLVSTITKIVNSAALTMIAIWVANFLFAGLLKIPSLVRQHLSRLLPKKVSRQVFALLEDDAKTRIYAATDKGIFQLQQQTWWQRLWRGAWQLIVGPQPEPWTAVPLWTQTSDATDGADLQVMSLAWDDEGRLTAGTQAGNIYTRLHSDGRWLANNDVPLTAVRKLVQTAGGLVAAGAPPSTNVEKDWAPSHLANGFVDTVDLGLRVDTSSHAVLLSDNGQGALLTVQQATETESQDLEQGGLLTRLQVAETADLPSFDRTKAHLYLKSELLTIADDQFQPQPVAGKQIVLVGQIHGLKTGQKLVIQGELMPEFTSAAEPIADEAPEAEAVVQAELVDVAQVSLRRSSQTVIHFKEGLRAKYKRGSIVVYGNVVPASQGQTIRRENLGESNGSVANQRFLLRSPLAYAAKDQVTQQSSLTVHVHDIPWKAVPTLLDHQANDRVYMVQRDDRGRTAVIFGDGNQGARLPTTRENLTATYRTGGGLVGNVPANNLNLLLSRAPYLQGVTNPLPATGGQQAEPANEGREYAPRRLLALGRIVTVSDYGDFVSAFPGVRKSAVRLVPPKKPQRIEITVVPRHQDPHRPWPEQPLAQTLETSIQAAQVASTLQIKTHLFKSAPFTLGLVVYPHPTLQGDEQALDQLQASIHTALLAAFQLGNRSLGQPVTEAEVFNVVQKVRGVTAVRLTSLHKTDGKVDNTETPRMLDAKWDELLWLEADSFKLDQIEVAQ